MPGIQCTGTHDNPLIISYLTFIIRSLPVARGCVLLLLLLLFASQLRNFATSQLRLGISGSAFNRSCQEISGACVLHVSPFYYYE